MREATEAAAVMIPESSEEREAAGAREKPGKPT